MKFKDYLEELVKRGDQYNRVTVIVAKAVKDEHSPFYHTEFRTTPIRTVEEWLSFKDKFLTYQVINKDHSPIDITGYWCNDYKKGQLKCCMLADENYLSTMYSKMQAKQMEEHYNKIK
jgi:hypothetical protein